MPITALSCTAIIEIDALSVGLAILGKTSEKPPPPPREACLITATTVGGGRPGRISGDAGEIGRVLGFPGWSSPLAKLLSHGVGTA